MALYIGGVAVDATAAEIDVLDGLDRGSIIYGNASSVTTVLDQGNADEVLTSDGTDIAWAAVAGGGDVSKVGTPANNEVGIWTGDGTIEGESNITYDGTTFGVDDAAVFNDSQGDNDFRVEGDNEEYLLFCDASTDRVGIGTDSPAQLLHLLSTTSGGKCILKMEDTNADDNPPTQQFVKNSESPAVNDYLGCTYYYGDDNALNVHTFGGISVQSSVVTDGSEEGMMNLMTSTAGALATTMTLKGDKVGIGTTSPDTAAGSVLHLKGSSSTTTLIIECEDSDYCGITFQNTSMTTNRWQVFMDAAEDFKIGRASVFDAIKIDQTSGNTYTSDGTVYSLASDERLKTDIRDFTHGLSVVNQLNPVYYKFNGKNNTTEDEEDRIGMLANVVKDIAPDITETTMGDLDGVDTELYTMSYDKLIFYAVNAIKELSAKVEALENE